MRRPVLTILAGILIAVTDAGTAQNGIVRYPASSQLTRDGTAVMLEDYASAPQSSPKFGGAAPPRNDFEGLPYQLARVNVLVSEPANAPRSASRFFVIDQNGFLYTLDKKTRQFTPYIDFGKGFPNFANASPNGGFGTGVSSIAFDPAYTRNGKFYTAHTEKPNMSRAGASSNVRLPVWIRPVSPQRQRLIRLPEEWDSNPY